MNDVKRHLLEFDLLYMHGDQILCARRDFSVMYPYHLVIAYLLITYIII